MRQIGRKRAIRRRNIKGHYWGMGPQEEDAVSGWLRPTQLMVQQRGGLVSRDYNDDSLDYPKEW